MTQFGAVSETQVNTSDLPIGFPALPFQENSSITALVDGGYVVVYEDASQDLDSFSENGNRGILAQIYNEDGSKRGDELKISNASNPTGDQTLPNIVAHPDGGFIVVFQDFDSSTDRDIEVNRYDAGGTIQNTETIGGSSDLREPDIEVFDDGSYAVVYSSDITVAGDNSEILIRIFGDNNSICLLYTSPSPRDRQKSRMPSSA